MKNIIPSMFVFLLALSVLSLASPSADWASPTVANATWTSSSSLTFNVSSNETIDSVLTYAIWVNETGAETNLTVTTYNSTQGNWSTLVITNAIDTRIDNGGNHTVVFHIHANNSLDGNRTLNRTIMRDTVSPLNLTIDTPASGSGVSQLSEYNDFNTTYDELHNNTCFFNLNSNSSNTSLSNCNTFSAQIRMVQGSNTIIFYVNDSAGNVNSTTSSWTYITTASGGGSGGGGGFTAFVEDTPTPTPLVANLPVATALPSLALDSKVQVGNRDVPLVFVAVLAVVTLFLIVKAVKRR